MKKILFSLIFMLSASAFGQSFSVFNIDTTNFPTMKANFLAFDSAGKQLYNFSPNDFEVLENGQARTITSVSCPPKKPIESLSSVLVIDVSVSMSSIGGGLDIAKSASTDWINYLNLGTSECALLSFSDQCYINRDFTTNKNNLKNGINSLQTIGGTNYDLAFLDSFSGALAIAQTGKHKRIIVFLTDGLPYSEPHTLEIIKLANANNITIYCLTIGFPAPECMKKFSKQTGGLCFENIENNQQAIECYRQILASAQGGEPCKIEWQSGYTCQAGTNNVSIKLLPFNIIQNKEYSSTINQIANLELAPTSLVFYNSKPGIKRDTVVTLTARNSDIKITNIISSNPAFSFDKTGFLIPKNQSVDLKVSYLPKDSNYVYTNISFETDVCLFEMSAVALFKGKKSSLKTLKITKPNGGEDYLVGSDSLISWEGIAGTDSVRLDYSIDGGKIWKKIIDKTPGLNYSWRDIPPPTSDNCLVRVTQLQNATQSQIEWQKCLGGTYSEYANSIQQTMDGGYVVAGRTLSTIVDNGKGDALIIKFNPYGVIEWQKQLGGTLDDQAYSIQQTIDGGLIVAGYAESTDGDVIGNKGDEDNWIVKLSNLGAIEWQVSLGGNGGCTNSIQQTSDYGFIIAGFQFGESTKNQGSFNALIAKLNSTGVIQWQKCLCGETNEIAYSIQQTNDGGFIVAGANEKVVSTDPDFWILKLDSTGAIEWQKYLGGSALDEAKSIQQTFDGGYIVAGWTASTDRDVLGNHGRHDAWIVKLNPLGELEWQKCWGGSDVDEASSIQQTSEGGYIVVGNTYSTDGDVNENHGENDAWIVKLNPLGELEWQKCLGGSKEDAATSISQTMDGGYIIAGKTTSTDGDVIGNHGGSDIWIVKLSSDGSIIQQDESDAVFSIVAPKATAIGVDMGKCFVNMSKDSVVTHFTQNVGSYKCRIDSIYIQGADSAAFKLIGGFPKYELDKDSSHFAEFDFSPTELRFYAAEIVVITQSDTLIVPITGECVSPQLNIICGVLNFGKVEIGNEKIITNTVVVKNISNSTIAINKTIQMYPNLEEFSIISGGGAFNLNPGESRQITLRFKPKFGGRTSGRIGFEYNGTGSPITATLFGTGIGGVVVSSSDSAYSGEKRNINITLKNIKPAGLKAMAKSFSANLKFQGRILAPQDFSQVLSFKNDSIIMQVSGDLPNDNNIYTIPMIAGLGNVEETNIEISDFKLYDNSGALIDYDMEVEYGTFKLLGICREGGTRLINPNAQAQILSVRPNPATNAINIEYQLTEKGGAEFLLINDLGETVKQISYGEISDYTQRLETIKLDELANGRYTLILKTPTISERRSVLVVK